MGTAKGTGLAYLLPVTHVLAIPHNPFPFCCELLISHHCLRITDLMEELHAKRKMPTTGEALETL